MSPARFSPTPPSPCLYTRCGPSHRHRFFPRGLGQFRQGVLLELVQTHGVQSEFEFLFWFASNNNQACCAGRGVSTEADPVVSPSRLKGHFLMLGDLSGTCAALNELRGRSKCGITFNDGGDHFSTHPATQRFIRLDQVGRYLKLNAQLWPKLHRDLVQCSSIFCFDFWALQFECEVLQF